jgi:cytosine/adenosine deaminase-related metal-dependent hydrolase
MAGMIPAPSSSLNFPDWIKSILALKAHWSYTEYAASWLKGAKQLLDSGCTTVFDIEAVPELLPEAWESTLLRVASFLEMTGVRSGHDPDRILREAELQRRRIGETARCETGLSPHALYSTPPELLKLVAEKMRKENLRVAIHLAESEAEWEMYQNARGPLYDWLKSQRPVNDCGGRSPIQRAHELGLLQPNLLAIHCNFLARGDAEMLAKNQVTVVHCPRSHAFFKHAPFPYEELRAAGVNVVIATDSLASIEGKKNEFTLDLWEEIRQFSKNHPLISSDTVFQMVTLNLARDPRFHAGSFAIGRAADIVCVRFQGQAADLPNYALSRNVTIAGRFVAGQRS